MSDPHHGTVALVDDDDDLRAATRQLLTLAGFQVSDYAAAGPARAAIDADFPGVVVTDVRMPGESGIDLFRQLHARDPDLPVILMTGHGDIAMAVDTLKAGAWDFLAKPFDPDALIAALHRAVTARALTIENRRLRRAAEAQGSDVFIGESPAIRRLRGLIATLADATLDCVIEGETGTGKEHYARLLHAGGRRARHRFTLVDCATIPAEMIERELFARNGIIARTDRGTLFLDQLHRSPPALHDRLARFVEARAVALDTRDPDAVDVRIIATIGDGDGAALPDTLYHRLAGGPLRMPPLAERTEDIPLLLAHLIDRAATALRQSAPPLGGWPARAMARAWPGNVRELARFAERLCLGIETPAEAPQGEVPGLIERIHAFERAVIEEAVAAANGEIATAIASLQIPRKTFYYRVNRLGIDLKALRRRR